MTIENLRDYFYGRSQVEQEAHLQRWFADNAETQQANDLLVELFDEIRVENPAMAQAAFERFCARIGASAHTSTKPTPITLLLHWTQRIAAMLILPLLVALSVLFTTRNNRMPEWSETIVPRGERSELVLSDGTKLWLNSGTRITYPSRFTGKQRKIFIDGELFAEVTADPKNPFIISAGDVEVKVLGTKFNMRAYNADPSVEVALVDGRVLFDVNSQKCDEQVAMHPNEVVQYDHLTGEIERSTFQSESYRSRALGGGFYFFNEPMASIAAQLSRNFDRRIVITSPGLETMQFYAFFTNNESLSRILDTFNTDGRLLIQEEQGTIYLSLKR